MARILLGVSGGIAAYKALELVRLATAAGHTVRVIQTPTSRRFVGGASFEALTGAPVLVSEFERDPARGAFPDERPADHEPIGHLELVAKADVFLVAPASANTIAKLAGGQADNLLTTAALAATCPVILAPAMNARMYEHPATQANLALLTQRGVQVVEPETGRLASKGEHGVGRLPDPAKLLAAGEGALRAAAQLHAHGGADAAGRGSDAGDALGATGGSGAGDALGAAGGSGAGDASGTADRGPWAGVRVLVTAGGTREPIDGVRFVGNTSSGRMGLALAEAALARGASVSVIAANISLPRPDGARWLEAPTAAQMQRACEQELPGCDVLLMAAAVADFRPVAPVAGKIKKRDRDSLTLRLEPTADVLAGLAAHRRESQTLVGFAAEHGGDGRQEARRKLAQKGLDAVVLNDVSRPDVGFGAQENEASVISADWEVEIPKAGKRQVAEAILDAVGRLRGM
jgi:phosphopantothenoylcysteine decarboxylase/phosphopantothenate--cysteine ligase